jgi:hypothetical protein
MAKWQSLDVEWSLDDFGAPLLDSIARGLYKKLEVFREYAQNAVDSYARLQSNTGLAPTLSIQIDIDEVNDSIQFLDEGIGMDEEDIKTAKKIAVSPKLERPSEYVGFRGIGIWAGLSACESIIITTSKFDVPYEFRMIIDCDAIVKHIYDPIAIHKLLQGNITIEKRSSARETHFTHVKLDKVKRDSHKELLDINEVTRYAEQNLPVPVDPKWDHFNELERLLESIPWTNNYPFTINNHPIYKRFPPKEEVKPPQLIELRPQGEKSAVAYAWVSETSKRGGSAKAITNDKTWVRNFAVRVKNFTVGSRGLYVTSEIPDKQNLDWYVGEIYIVDPDIKPDSSRQNLQPTRRYGVVVEALQEFYAGVAARARGWSAQVIIEDQIAEVKERILAIEGLISGSGPVDAQSNRQIKELFNESKLGLSIFKEKLQGILDQISETTGKDESLSKQVLRNYYSKPEVKRSIESALGSIARVERSTEERIPGFFVPQDKLFDNPTEQPKKNKRATPVKASKSRTAKLSGSPVTLASIVATQTEVGSSADGISLTAESTAEYQEFTSINLILEAFAATISATFSKESEYFLKLIERFPEELRRRGFDV